MGIRTYKPTSAGRRGGQVSDFAEITDRKKRPEKALVSRFKRRGGRNFQGKITCRHHCHDRARISVAASRRSLGNALAPAMTLKRMYHCVPSASRRIELMPKPAPNPSITPTTAGKIMGAGKLAAI